MKIIRWGLAALLFAGIARAEEFDLAEYAPETGTVWIKTKDGQTKRPLNSFGAEEQKKITGWLADKEFQTSSGLSVTAEQQKKKDKTISTIVTPEKLESGARAKTLETTEGKVQDVSYVIKLENLSRVEFQDVGVEYRIFYETQERSEETKKCERGTAVREKLLPGEIWILETSSIAVRDAQKDTVSVEWKGRDIKKGSRDMIRSVSVKDRLKGMHLFVSKKGSNGETIERECIVGAIPEKENWADYQQQEKPNPAEQVLEAQAKRPTTGRNMSEKQLRNYIQNGKNGNYMSALVVAEYYYGQGDQEKTKEWADRVRKLVKSRPKEQREEAAERLAVLDQMEETATSR